LQDQPGLRPDRAGVVLEMRAVGRADLAQERTRAALDVGDPELPTDLDQLAPGDDHFLAARQALQGEKDRGRAVVDDERGLGAGGATQERLEVRVAGAA